MFSFITCGSFPQNFSPVDTESAVDAIKSEDLQGAVTALTSHANEEVKKLAEVLKEKL